MTSWYVCFLSIRFWQFLLLNFVLGAPDDITDRLIHKNESIWGLVSKLVANLFIALVYDRVGFKRVLSFMILIQIGVSTILFF